MNQPDHPNQNPARDAAPAAPAALWASAFVLTGLVLALAGRGLGTSARAEMVSNLGEYTIMTTDGGAEEVLLVLDNRNENLLVYKVKNQKDLELYQKLDLPRVFGDARRAGSGRN